MAVTDEQLARLASVQRQRRSWADDPDEDTYEDVVLVTVAYRTSEVAAVMSAEPLASGLLPADAIRVVGQPVVDALTSERQRRERGQ